MAKSEKVGESVAMTRRYLHRLRAYMRTVIVRPV
jgi:hypothetical protein